MREIEWGVMRLDMDWYFGRTYEDKMIYPMI